MPSGTAMRTTSQTAVMYVCMIMVVIRLVPAMATVMVMDGNNEKIKMQKNIRKVVVVVVAVVVVVLLYCYCLTTSTSISISATLVVVLPQLGPT